MTDDGLIELNEKAIRDAMDAANKRDGFASSGSRESIVAGLRLVAEAAWDEGHLVHGEDYRHNGYCRDSGGCIAVNPYRKGAR